MILCLNTKTAGCVICIQNWAGVYSHLGSVRENFSFKYFVTRYCFKLWMKCILEEIILICDGWTVSCSHCSDKCEGPMLVMWYQHVLYYSWRQILAMRMIASSDTVYLYKSWYGCIRQTHYADVSAMYLLLWCWHDMHY